MPETLPLIYLDYLLISFNEEKVIYFLLSTNIFIMFLPEHCTTDLNVRRFRAVSLAEIIGTDFAHPLHFQSYVRYSPS